MQSFELIEQTPGKERGLRICRHVSGQASALSLRTGTFDFPDKAKELSNRKINVI